MISALTRDINVDQMNIQKVNRLIINLHFFNISVMVVPFNFNLC